MKFKDVLSVTEQEVLRHLLDASSDNAKRYRITDRDSLWAFIGECHDRVREVTEKFGFLYFMFDMTEKSAMIYLVDDGNTKLLALGTQMVRNLMHPALVVRAALLEQLPEIRQEVWMAINDLTAREERFMMMFEL